MARVLITGGAGFIGSHAADVLLEAGHQVRVLDNLTAQVHGPGRQSPDYLDSEVQLVVGDVTDPAAVDRTLRDVDMVLHLASAVGVGQSMYDIASYVQTNEVGTAILLEALTKRSVQRLVIASSMSIYGEGLCRDASNALVYPEERTARQLRSGRWELESANGELLTPLPTPETKQPTLSSVYALNKYAQERLCLMIGKAYGISTAALRFLQISPILPMVMTSRPASVARKSNAGAWPRNSVLALSLISPTNSTSVPSKSGAMTCWK
jgi:dTDP-L-rhamnose 4-epimerase